MHKTERHRSMANGEICCKIPHTHTHTHIHTPMALCLVETEERSSVSKLLRKITFENLS